MMSQLPPELEEVFRDLGRCIEALGPYKETAVLTGGLAAILYRWCSFAVAAARPPVMTFDMDWALPMQTEKYGEGLHKMLKQGGFRPWLQGEGSAPVTYYQHERHGSERLAPIHVEFIAPRPGSPRDRHGNDLGIIEVEPELHAQTDPYIALLLVENITFDVSCVAATGLSQPQVIRLPNPICYVLQKILIRGRRQRHKRAGDAAHIYEVALLTRDLWPKMAEALSRIESNGLFPSKWFQRAKEAIGIVFLEPEAPGPSEIVHIYQNIAGPAGAPTEAAVARVLRQFSEATGLLEKPKAG